MGQINTNNYPTVDSLADADLLIVENATNGTGTTTPKQLRENAIGTDTLQTASQTVTGAINELKGEIDAGAGVVCYDVDTITSGYLGGQFSGAANLLLLHLTTDGTADTTNGYMMMLSYTRPVARFAYGRLVDSDGVAYKQDVYADNTIICKISDSGTGTESDPKQVVILGIINAGFMLTPTAVVSDRDIIDGQGNTLSVLAEALTKTASGNPVVISDCAGGKARSLITEINAIQGLHGQPFPYVGGAYKNKFDLANIDTDYFSVNNQTITNTQTDTVNKFELYVQTMNNGSIVDRVGDIIIESTGRKSLSFTLSGTFTHLRFKHNGYSRDLIIALMPWTATGDFTISFDVVGYNPSTAGGLVLSNIQLESGTTATSFAPYSNICPISGRTAAVVTRSDGDEISEDFTIQLGQTVYDGDADWNMGDGSSRTGKYTLNGTEGVNWSLVNTDPTRQVIYANIQGVLTNPKTTGRKQAGGIFSGFYYAPDYAVGVAFIDANNGVWLNMTFEPNKFTDSNDFKTWLATNNIEFTYELATPIELTLTPTEVQMLKGYNRVTIESGSIEIGYIAKLT
jgi:hypothetical protein